MRLRKTLLDIFLLDIVQHCDRALISQVSRSDLLMLTREIEYSIFQRNLYFYSGNMPNNMN